MTSSSSRKTLLAVLGATLLALTAVVIWRPGLEGPKTLAIGDLDLGSIKRLAVSGPEAGPIALERQGDRWLIAEPAQLPADPSQLNDVLAAARARSRASYLLSAIDLEATGLDRPGVTLSVGDLTLEFGQRAPVSGDRYVRVGRQIHLVSDAHYHTLTQPLDAYVGTRLFPDNERLQVIRLPGVELRRVAEDRWAFQGENPNETLATDLARQWETLAAAALQPYSPATDALGRVEILRDGSDQAIAFDIIEIPGKADFVLGREDAGLQYHFAPELGRRLLSREQPSEDADARTP